jgi:hypothetical protein
LGWYNNWDKAKMVQSALNKDLEERNQI